MSHLDLEQGTIGGDRRFSFHDDVESYVSWYHSNTFGYYSDNDEYSTSNSEGSSVCRICKSEVGPYGQGLMELGCSCKNDLASVHRECAVTWFKLKGDEVCEICHSVARNVAGGNEMMEEEEEEEVVMVEDGGGGERDVAVGEDGKSWWQRHLVLIIAVICWVTPFLMYFLIRIRL